MQVVHDHESRSAKYPNESMTITELDIHLLSLPLLRPFQTANGIESHVETVLVHARTDSASAWVETCPLRLPTYTAECANSVFHMIRDVFGPLIVGTELTDRRSVQRVLERFEGNQFAKAGLDLCWWALEAVSRGVPLRDLIGGNLTEISARKTFGVYDSIEMFLGELNEAVDDHTPGIKLKIDKSWNHAAVAAARERLPTLPVSVDCNGVFTPSDTGLLVEIANLGVAMIEQPFEKDDFAAHAALQGQIDVPVCLDESIRTRSDLEQAIQMRACRAMSIKVGRIGGLTPALEAVELCEKSGMSCYVGSMFETGIGSGINIELATRLPASVCHGITVPLELYSVDVVDPAIGVNNGQLATTTGPYLGREVDTEMIQKLTKQQATVRS